MAEEVSTPPAPDGPAAEVCAVVVSHRPDLAVLSQALAALRAQVGHVVVVDNGSPGPDVHAIGDAHPGIEVLALPENLGLAAGLNAGVRVARARPGVTQVLLMDQDSVPASGMVATLQAALAGLSRTGKVAAVGPRYRDARETADAPFVRIGFPFNHKLRCNGEATIRCDFLITSGCLVPLAVLDEVGGMDEALFIDNVDVDWCFRATAMGYTVHGVCAARLDHRLGDARRRVAGAPRAIVVHPPWRLFYMMRNRVLLYRRRHTPWRWVAQDVLRLPVKLFLFAVLVPPRLANLRQMLAGLRAGIAGRTDPPAHGR